MSRHVLQLDIFRQRAQIEPQHIEPALPPKRQRDLAYARWIEDGAPWPLPAYMAGVLSAALDACMADGRFRTRDRR